MATNVEESSAADVANSLLFGGGLSVDHPPEPGASEGSVWPLLAPTVLVLALLLLATAYAGAFAVAEWGPPTLFILLMLLTLLVRGGAQRLPDRWLGLSLAGAWGLAAWAALSATWAASAGAALEGAGRQVMYAVILTLPLVAVGDLRSLRVAARGVVGGIALIALYTLARMFIDGPSIFLAGRLNGPVEYRNATALLFCIAFWPLIVTAATRGQGRALRAVCLGLAVLMLGLAFLTQSRGVVIGLGCGAVVVVLLGPDRVRRLWLAILSAVLLACASPWLLKPYHAFTGHHVVGSTDIASAGAALSVLVLVSVAVGFLLAVFDAGLRPASEAMPGVRSVARAGLLAALLALLAGGLIAAHGNPVHELRVKWRDFKSLQGTNTTSTRYTSTGGQRYDLWRVAAREFRANPVGGVGEGSYEFDYYRLRRSNRNLSDPHGLLFQLGSELGAVGLLLFGSILVGLIGSIKRWWPLAPLDVRRSVCGLAAAGATFIGQSLVDWMWRIPGLTALGVLCLGVAAALLARSVQAVPGAGAQEGAAAAEQPSASRVRGVLGGRFMPVPHLRSWRRPAAASGLLLALALVACLYLSNFYVRRARDELGHSPAAQLADARTASALDPWWVEPHYLEASALESMGDRGAARAQLKGAQRMIPAGLVPLGLLGDFEARGGRFEEARAYYRRALVLDPLDVGLQQLARSGGRP